jgi:hypothetical protein
MSSLLPVALSKGAIEVPMCFCELVWRVMPCADLLVSSKCGDVDHVHSVTKISSSMNRCVSASASLKLGYIL